MGISGGIILIAIGAILRWAVTIHANGVNFPMIGNILMIVGAIGVVLSLLFLGTGGLSRRRYYDDDPRL